MDQDSNGKVLTVTPRMRYYNHSRLLISLCRLRPSALKIHLSLVDYYRLNDHPHPAEDRRPVINVNKLMCTSYLASIFE